MKSTTRIAVLGIVAYACLLALFLMDGYAKHVEADELEDETVAELSEHDRTRPTQLVSYPTIYGW